MPKAIAVPFPEMLEAIKLHKIFDETNRLKPRSHQVWKEICKTFRTKYNPETLQSYVRENRGHLMENLKKHFKLPAAELNESANINDSSEFDTSQEYLVNNNLKKRKFKCPPQNYNLVIIDDEWRKISPTNKMYRERGTNGRCYQLLRSGWAHILSKAFYLKSNIPCAYTFKYAKVFTSAEAETYLKIHGSCKQCGATFDAHCLQEPRVNEGITLRVNTFDTSGLPHSAKRPITGQERLEAGEQLVLKNPQMWRNEKADDMAFGDPEPPYLPNSAAIRKIKEEAVNRQLGVDGRIGAINSLDKLKNQGKYAGYIKDIGHNKFHVFYWSPMQLHLYKDLIKKYNKIEIDATGKLTLEIIASNGDKRVTYLYQIVIKGDEGKGVQPLFQMISEKHDANFITYWLREILRAGAPKPLGVDCDYSMALLNAVSLAFNEKTLAGYIADCFRWLQSVELQFPLLCYIRIDIAHLIKIICQKKIFKGKLPKVKDYFVRCVAIMASCTDIDDFKELLLDTLIVAESEFDGVDEAGENVVCSQKKAKILQRIKTFIVPEEILSDPTIDREYDHLDFEAENEDIKSFINNIYENAMTNVKATEQTETGNDLYCPGITKHLLRFARHFPLWTNVLSKYFSWASDVASSARCEEYFKELKHQELGPNYRPMRADKFIVKHIKSIERVSKLEKAKISKRKDDKDSSKSNKVTRKTKKPQSEDENEHLKEQENWFGLNQEAKKRKIDSSINEDQNTSVNTFIESSPEPPEPKETTIREISPLTESNINRRGKYVRPCPDIEIIYGRPLRKRRGEILPNGSLCEPVFIEGERTYIKNTCSFDAISEVFTNSYCNFPLFKEFVDANSDIQLFKFVSKYASEGISKGLYVQRAKMLTTSFKTKNNILNCWSNAAIVLRNLIVEAPSYTYRQSEGMCTVVNKVPFLEMDGTDGERTLTEYINYFILQTLAKTKIKCRACKSNHEMEFVPGPYIIIETQIYLCTNKKKYPNGVRISEIPVKICVQNIQYVLAGFVRHTTGHYEAYCRSPLEIWTQHSDTCKNPKKVNMTAIIVPELIFYIKI